MTHTALTSAEIFWNSRHFALFRVCESNFQFYFFFLPQNDHIHFVSRRKPSECQIEVIQSVHGSLANLNDSVASLEPTFVSRAFR